MADDLNTLERFAKKLYVRQACYHPLAPANCAGGFINAHTIPHAGLLRIARQGEVYTYNYVPRAGMRKLDIMQPLRQGASKASTFVGFCGMHDHATFEPIEAHPFCVDSRHIFLASYRSLCLRLFRQQVTVDRIDELRNFYQHDPDELAALEERQHLAQSNLAIFEHMKRTYDAAFLAADYSALHFYAVTVTSTPVYLGTETIPLYLDFAGNVVQDLSLANPDRAFLNFIVTAEGHIILSWLGGNPAAQRVVDSLRALPVDQILPAITRFAFTFVVNLYMAPDWWDALAPDDRADLAQRQVDAKFHGTLPANDCLIDNGCVYTSMQIANIHVEI